jgi:hypothetical protein
MSQDLSAARPLPAYGAFVVQFCTGTNVARGQFVRRIEHVVSGQATHFRTLEACLVFVGRMLPHVPGQPSEEAPSHTKAWQAGSDRTPPQGRHAVK